ncbi:MAG: glycoside hydrolase family 3 N-terminal domain-containing protein, partial [Pseudomonadota bacterium]
ARVSADEATAAGLHWTFAPMVDIARDPRWGRIVEGAGSDPYLGSRMAEAQVRGYQGTDLGRGDTMMAATKHLGAYGAAEGGRDYGAADISERVLHEDYLPPFEAAAREGSLSFMTAFNDIAGVPTTANEALIDGVLRERWGWEGLIVSDWNAIAELMNHGVAGARHEAGALALKAGVDMDMTSGIFGDDLREAIAKQPALMADLDAAVTRILMAKERLGLFDDPYAYHDVDREARSLLTDETREAAKEAAIQSMVLLKNDGVLPLQPDASETIAVIGRLADDRMTQLGSWRAQGRPEDVTTILEAIQAAVPERVRVTYHPGPDDVDDGRGVRAAVRVARRADHVILVTGEHYDLSGEARSRSSVELPNDQQQLADAILGLEQPVSTLLVTGRPLAIPEVAERSSAILLTWMLGVEAGPAVVDVVFGKRSPGGKLPVSFPRRTGQAPLTYSHLPSGRPANPDLSRDSNRYTDLPITPLFAFGHGLSYSSFSYEDLNLSAEAVPPGESIRVTINVRNDGNVPADEVVQLYLRDPVASISRPTMQLCGFRRVRLQPGEVKSVFFDVTPEQMAIWKAGEWVVEPGKIDVMVGGASDAIALRGSFSISEAGTGSASPASIATQVSVQ